MTPQGIGIIAAFCTAVIVGLIHDKIKQNKAGAGYEAKYAGRHKEDFSFGRLKGFITDDNILIFKCGMKGYFEVDLKTVKSISAYAVNGGCYVSIVGTDGKEVISKAKLGMVGSKEDTKRFMEMILRNASWIQSV